MISVPGSEELILLEIEAFLAASESVRFEGQSRTERCRWVERLLCRHEYPTQSRRTKGLLRAYIGTMAGLSRVQTARLTVSYVKTSQTARAVNLDIAFRAPTPQRVAP